MTTVNDLSLPRPCRSGDRIMWLTHERIFYAGLLGAPVMHEKGAITVYVAIEGCLRVRLQGGEWQAAEVVVVQPYVPHEIASEGRHAIDLLIEPETVDASRLPPWLRASTP